MWWVLGVGSVVGKGYWEWDKLLVMGVGVG